MDLLFDSILLAQQMEAPVAQQSYLMWMFQSLGPFYGIALPVLGLLLFLGACLVVGLSRRPAVIAAYLAFLLFPLMLGLFGSIQGAITSFSVIASSTTTPRPSDIARGTSMSWFTSLFALLVTFPSYFVVSLGLFVRTLQSGSNHPDKTGASEDESDHQRRLRNK